MDHRLHFDDRFNSTVPMDPKSQYAQWFQGEQKMPDGRLRFRCADGARTPSRIKKGDFPQGPQMIVKGPQQGSSIRAFLRGVIELPGRRHQARYGVSGPTSVPFGKLAASSPLVCFHFTALPGAMRSQKKFPQACLSMRS